MRNIITSFLIASILTGCSFLASEFLMNEKPLQVVIPEQDPSSDI